MTSRGEDLAMGHEAAVAEGDGPDPAAAIFGAGLDQARRFAELLAGSAVEWGLIGPREVPKIWERHILNCVVLSPAIPAEARVADVGSGAGLPGIVLAVARPDITVVLVEPLLRRVTWLQEAVDQLGLPNVEIVRSRAEDLAAEERDFDVVTARAVAALPKLLGWCLPLLRPGGVFLALKGESVAAEVAEATPVLVALHASSWTVESMGAGLVEPPARVVRVVAGEPSVRSTSGRSGRSGSSDGASYSEQES
jgi:16S rRNA (guanine527-N7)-methyltransferase